MTHKKNIFLTGSTGLLGSYLAKIFLQSGFRVYCLARSKNNKTAKERVSDALCFWDNQLIKCFDDFFVIVEGDIEKKNFGLDHRTLNVIKKNVHEIFHCAAITEINRPLAELRNVNVGGARSVFEFALSCRNLTKINHVSTAYVCGNHEGVFRESDLYLGQDFCSNYERSKFEAELLVEYYRKKDLWIDVYRPPIIVGHSKNGKTCQFKNAYQLLDICRLEVFEYLPILQSHINAVPINEVSRAIFLISSCANEKNKNYHPFPNMPISIEYIIDKWCKSIKVKKPIAVKEDDFKTKHFTAVQKAILKQNIYAINFKAKLDSDFSLSVLKRNEFTFSTIGDDTLAFLFKYYTENKAKF